MTRGRSGEVWRADPAPRPAASPGDPEHRLAAAEAAAEAAFCVRCCEHCGAELPLGQCPAKTASVIPSELLSTKAIKAAQDRRDNISGQMPPLR